MNTFMRILRVQLDKKTNFSFSVETPNPKLSKSLLEKIIIELNNYVRQIELNESRLIIWRIISLKTPIQMN